MRAGDDVRRPDKRDTIVQQKQLPLRFRFQLLSNILIPIQVPSIKYNRPFSSSSSSHFCASAIIIGLWSAISGCGRMMVLDNNKTLMNYIPFSCSSSRKCIIPDITISNIATLCGPLHHKQPHNHHHHHHRRCFCFCGRSIGN